MIMFVKKNWIDNRLNKLPENKNVYTNYKCKKTQTILKQKSTLLTNYYDNWKKRNGWINDKALKPKYKRQEPKSTSSK